MVKNLPAHAGDACSTMGQEDPLEEELATYSSILAGKTSWTVGYSPCGHRAGHDLATERG